MPEGHTIHRLARRHRRLLQGSVVRASSPQGRFAEGAALLDGLELRRTDAWGKHLFHEYAEPGAPARTRASRLLHVHLGLYGKFADGAGPAPEARGALRLRLESDEHWLDLRGPIACELLEAPERDALVGRLGPDPLRTGVEPVRATARVLASRAPVGTLLMDQAVVAGIGNVYRAELLFRHGLHPLLPGRQVPEAVWLALWDDLVVLMRAGVRAGRIVTTEPEDRERASGPARRSDAHYVYRRTGLPCRRCGTLVQTAVQAARNVFWCPVCQPEGG